MTAKFSRQQLLSALEALGADEVATVAKLEDIRSQILVVLEACRDARISFDEMSVAHGATWQALHARLERSKLRETRAVED